MAEALDPETVIRAREGSQHTRKVLVKKPKPPAPIKKYVWLAGHGSTLVFGSIYLVFYVLKWFLRTWRWTPRICYVLSLVGVFAAYSITVLTTFGSVIPPYSTLLATENFQLMVIAMIWIFSRPSAFKLAPYLVISLLQLSSEFKIEAVLKLQNQLGEVVTMAEFVIIVVLIVDTLLFRGTSGYALALYLGFYWLRVNFSPYTQSGLLKIMNLVDDKFMKNNKSAIKPYWDKSKGFVEFRRSQTKRTHEEGLTEEPPVKVDANVDHSKQGSVLKDDKNPLPIGQVVNRTEKPSYGAKLPESKASNIYAGVGKGDETPEQIYERNFKAGAYSAGLQAGRESQDIKNSSAGFSEGDVKVGKGFQKSVPPIPDKSPLKTSSKESLPNTPTSRVATTTSQSSVKPAGTQTTSSSLKSAGVAVNPQGLRTPKQSEASTFQQQGTPQSPSTPSRAHALDAREQLIAKAKQIKGETNNGNNLSNVKQELDELQKRAQDAIDSTQG